MVKRVWRTIAMVGLISSALLAGGGLHAKEALPAVPDPVLEARMVHIAEGLRCLVCQNQTIADSHADLASDLRQEIREMLKQGKNEEQINAYMTERYGDFVLYRPPVKPTTVLLWFGPALLMGVGLITLIVILRRRAKLPDAAFDPDDALEHSA